MTDNTRINDIENGLKNNPSSVSNSDLIYYLKIKSNNNVLDPNNLSNTEEYLKKINNSFFYENIFVNTSNYNTIVYSIIGLLIPFYYFYPRFYNLGFFGLIIGFISLFSLYSITNNLYLNFFGNINYVFIGLTVFIYLIFFILLNKLNHISLFFISAVLAFVIINFFSRVILSIPNNEYSQYSANINNNTTYTQYNVLIETACFQIMSRYNLNLPSGNMLYSYLTVFDIGQNSNMISNFLTNLFGPILSLIVLYLLGYFLSKVNSNGNELGIFKLFPIIGFDENSKNIFCSQANYILPKELNINLLINNKLDNYNFNDDVYSKLEKAFIRISNELLEKYNPKFMNLDNINKDIILKNLKDNKIFQRINKILKINKIDFDINYIDKIKDLINEENVQYSDKEKMLNLLDKIDNTLLIKNKVNKKYDNNSILARNELLYDKDIDEKYKEQIKKITDEYIKDFTENLNLKEGILYGYDYNIITYSWLGQNIRNKANNILKYILKFISVWILFGKILGSPILFGKYIMSEKIGFKGFMENMTEGSFIWKYFSMGLDKSAFEDILENMKNNKETSFIESGLNIFYIFLIFIVLLPIFYFYNSINSGLTLNPSWYNILYQIMFIINILGNLYSYNNGGSILLFNIKFLIAFVIIFILIMIISYAIKNV
jgi:hypothetical protein